MRRLPLYLAGATFALHALGNPHYGFFRDELYFIICGRHPQFGYVDQPPLAPLTAAFTQMFGPSLFLLRLIPALCAAAAVYAAALIAIELGGGAFAVLLASITTALAPVMLAFGMKVGPDEFEMFLWAFAALFALRVVTRAQPRWWIWCGVCIGIAAQAKYSIVFFSFGLIIATLLTKERRWMLTRDFALGVAAAVLIALPNFLWQAYYHFPMLELLRNGQQGKNVVFSPLDFFLQTVLICGPSFAPFWLIGFYGLLRDDRARFLGYAFALTVLAMLATHAKPYYPSPAWPIVFAAGAWQIEAWTAARRVLKPAIAAYAVLTAALLIPVVMPVLPIESVVPYMGAIHLKPVRFENNKVRDLPQDFADMRGWPELTEAVAHVFAALPAAQRTQAVIFSDNYGEASAINFFGPAYGLPPSLSGHNQYYLWGPQGYSGNVVIKIGGDIAQLRSVFGDVRLAQRFSNPQGMPYEDDLPIYICRQIKIPLAQLWPQTKNYI